MTYIDPDAVVSHLVSPVTVRALGWLRDPEYERQRLTDMLSRQQRRCMPRPGGAAREMEIDIDVPGEPWDNIHVRLPRQRDGGSITLVHETKGGLTLHSGNILGTPFVQLPETILTAIKGIRIGDVVDLAGGGLAALADAPITAVFENDNSSGHRLVFHLDAKQIPLRLSHLGKDN